MTTSTDRRCPDCQVAPGERHQDGCDVSQCPTCGQQALQCAAHLDAGQSRWTGEWPGSVECREFGWFAHWTQHSGYGDATVPDTGPEVRCEAKHPHAHHDLNRLALEAARGTVVWDKALERYV